MAKKFSYLNFVIAKVKKETYNEKKALEAMKREKEYKERQKEKESGLSKV